MEDKLSMKAVYEIAHDDIVARDLHGEFIIIPISSGIGDMEDEIYSLNETGKAVWEKLDGKNTLEEVISKLVSDFEGSEEEISKDAVGIIGELLSRKMIVEAKSHT